MAVDQPHKWDARCKERKRKKPACECLIAAIHNLYSKVEYPQNGNARRVLPQIARRAFL